MPAIKEKINTYSTLLTTIGNKEITAKYVVNILGLDIKTKKACRKAVLLLIFSREINFSEDDNAFLIYLIEKYNNNNPPTIVKLL